MRLELLVNITTFKINSTNDNTWSILLQVLDKFQYRDKVLNVDPDYEYALLGGVVYVGRYY